MPTDFRRYNAPNGTLSSIDDVPANPDVLAYGSDLPNGLEAKAGYQIVEEAYWRKAITLAMRDMYFMQLAEVKDMPRNSGKVMKANVYIPVLDDRNLSDEGLDALGQPLDAELWYVFEDGAIASTTSTAGYATQAAAVAAITNAATQRVTPGTANMYGGSRDVGTITAKLPVLSEGAQRVNRVGAQRQIVEGSIEQFGFFNEYTEDSVQFDTDAELMMHITTEMIHAATEITEDTLQKDLLNSAAVVRYAGTATAINEIGLAERAFLSYNDFVRLSIQLDLNRTPKHTTVITGSRMIDTKTVNAARFMYIAPEMVPEIETLTDYQGNRALIDVRQYEGQTTTMNGEIGTVHNFRIIVNPEMQIYQGQGADISATPENGLYYQTGDFVDVFPLLTVGEDSFSTIGFMSDGKKRNTKFTIHHLKPGPDSVTRENPYGNMGLMSIRWWYGFLLKRPERIACMFAPVALDPTPPSP